LPQRSEISDACKKATLENEARKTLAQIFGGLILLAGLAFTWLTVQSTWESIDLTRQEQITARFSRAVDQLASEKLEARLGGVYALERIAKDSEDDHRTMVEVLAAFVREESRREADQDKQRSTGELGEMRSSGRTSLPTDVQAALTVLGRRYGWRGVAARDWQTARSEFEPDPLNLSKTNLAGANLHGANFSGANLRGADLSRVDFSDANLREADLSGAYFRNADLSEANLRDADLSEANLSWTYLRDADLIDVDLFGANLTGAILDHSDMSRATIYRTNLSDAHLINADLDGAKFEEATLIDASLLGTYLPRADLRGAAGVTQDQIKWVNTCNATTRLPPGLRCPPPDKSRRADADGT
jgi:uncharacterized protein YjbI with pentapeptide repeats